MGLNCSQDQTPYRRRQNDWLRQNKTSQETRRALSKRPGLFPVAEIHFGALCVSTCIFFYHCCVFNYACQIFQSNMTWHWWSPCQTIITTKKFPNPVWLIILKFNNINSNLNLIKSRVRFQNREEGARHFSKYFFVWKLHQSVSDVFWFYSFLNCFSIDIMWLAALPYQHWFPPLFCPVGVRRPPLGSPGTQSRPLTLIWVTPLSGRTTQLCHM